MRRIESNQGAPTPRINPLLRRTGWLAATTAAVLAVGCGDREQQKITVVSKAEPAAPKVASPSKPKEASNTELNKLVGRNRSPHRVVAGPDDYKDISLERVARRMSEYRQAYADGCTNGPNDSSTTEVPVYTPVKGATLEVRVHYRPGEDHLHGSLKDLPKGLSPNREFFGYFEGERHELPAEVDRQPLGAKLYFDLPETVSIPGTVPAVTREQHDQALANKIAHGGFSPACLD